ncbi:MAG: threonine-phosphate decarboxylase CobD [Parvibaculaceae bacterium]
MSNPTLPLQTNMLAHGGRLNDARRLFPSAPEPFIDLSTGINPVAYPIPIFNAEVFSRLPEPEDLEELQSVAAQTYGAANAAMVAAAPGTQILIDLLPRLFPCEDVTILGPTYAEHGAAWKRAGAVVKAVTSWVDLEQAQNVVICNPNNPDGRRSSGEDLVALADRLAKRDGLLIIDEAFVDFEDAEWSTVRLLPRPNIIVLRSFGKSYGLAGLRLGFAITSPEMALLIRTALGPWAVSGPAIVVGRQALADEKWFQHAIVRLDADVARLDAMLLAAGFHIVGGTKLYRLGDSPSAAKIFKVLGKSGILIRRFEEQPHWLRFGIPGDEAQWRRLQNALLAVRQGA